MFLSFQGGIEREHLTEIDYGIHNIFEEVALWCEKTELFFPCRNNFLAV